MIRLALLALLFFSATALARPISRPYSALKADCAQERGYELAKEGKVDQAIQELDAAIRLDPTNAAAFRVRAYCRVQMGHLPEAISDYNFAIKLDPQVPTAFTGRGGVWGMLREWDKAIADLDEAIRLDPKNANAFLNRGAVWSKREDWTRSIADLSEAIRLDPRDSVAFSNRGLVWDQVGAWEKALKDYDEAVRLDPKDVQARSNRAFIRASCSEAKYRDGKKAVADMLVCCEQTEWKQPKLLAMLAAAYAECGEFDLAVKWQMKALDDPNAAKTNPAFVAALFLYTQKFPFRASGR